MRYDLPMKEWSKSDWMRFLREKMIQLWPNLIRAHTIDIVVRRDGRDAVYEADFLKHFQFYGASVWDPDIKAPVAKVYILFENDENDRVKVLSVFQNRESADAELLRRNLDTLQGDYSPISYWMEEHEVKYDAKA